MTAASAQGLLRSRARTPQAAGALRAFFSLADRWKLGRGERTTLLAASDRSIDRWRANPDGAELTRDQLERLSYILAIYGGLHAMLAESPFADAWIRTPNADFDGRTPLDLMLGGNVGDLLDVRRYVDAWRNGW